VGKIKTKDFGSWDNFGAMATNVKASIQLNVRRVLINLYLKVVDPEWKSYLPSAFHVLHNVKLTAAHGAANLPKNYWPTSL
jgi:hypothetical protein